MKEQIPAITLYNPWACWVMLGWKTIETRTHDRFKGLVGKTIGIHAGEYDWSATYAHEGEKFHSLALVTLRNLSPLLDYPRGLLGTVEVTEARWLEGEVESIKAMIDCIQTKRFGLFLKNPQWFPHAQAMKGGQGIFYVRERNGIYVKEKKERKPPSSREG